MEKDHQKTTMEQKAEKTQQVVKKPFYKKKSFWAAVVTGIALIAGGGYAYKRHTAKSSKGESSPNTTPDTPRQEDFRNDRGNRDFRRHGGERTNSN